MARHALWFLCVLATAGRLAAAELHLRQRAVAAGPVVLLGELAEIHAADPLLVAELAAIELFPSPAAGKSRFVTLRELRDVLELHGHGLAQHRLSGASRVELAAAAVVEPSRPPKPLAPAPAPPPILKPVVVRALAEHLAAQVPGTTAAAWQIELEWNDELARCLAEYSGSFVFRGGEPPWTGTQRFHVERESGGEPCPLVARIARAAGVVVATRNLAKGAIVTPHDVALDFNAPWTGKTEPLLDLDAAVGKETSRAIGAGQVLGREAIRDPVLVRRGEVVTVYARGPGLQVRTTARAQDDGSLGEAVLVESFEKRQKYLARVSGLQEVEVLVGASAVIPPAAGRPASAAAVSARPVRGGAQP